MKIKDKWRILLLIAIFLIGLFFRVYRLDYLSLWLDEGWSVFYASKSLLEIMQISIRDVHPPLYLLVLHYWINLFGDSEFSVRFLSLVFGSLSIFMIYKVANLIFNKEIGLISALILSLSAFHIQYAQTVRMYTLMSFLTLLSIYFLISLIKNPRQINFIGYIISTTLLLYTHYMGCFVLIAQGIYMGLLYAMQKEVPLKIEKWIFSLFGIIILFTPWINNMAKIFVRVEQEGYWVPKPSINSLQKTFLAYSGYGKLSEILFTLFIILLIFSAITNFEKKDSKIYFLLLWLLIPIVLPYTISLVSTSMYHTRYTILSSLAFYILIAKGISIIASKHIKLVIISIIIIFSLTSVHDYYTYHKNEEWRGLASFISKSATSKDFILLHKYFPKIFNYYFKRIDIANEPFPSCSSKEDCRNKVNNLLKNHDRIWLVLNRVSQKEVDVISDELRKYYKVLDVKYFYGITLVLFR